MAKIQLKGANLLAPLPVVMVSVANGDKANILTVAWTGIICSVPPRVYISVRHSRFSYELLQQSREFVINFTSERLLACCDWCGIRSGRDVDKFAEMQLTKGKANLVSAPIITESPVCLECRVFDVVQLGSHDMFLADVLAVDVDEELVDETGAIDYSRAHLVSYLHGEYFATGRKLGRFGFAAQKKYIRAYGKGKDVACGTPLAQRGKPKRRG